MFLGFNTLVVCIHRQTTNQSDEQARSILAMILGTNHISLIYLVYSQRDIRCERGKYF